MPALAAISTALESAARVDDGQKPPVGRGGRRESDAERAAEPAGFQRAPPFVLVKSTELPGGGFQPGLSFLMRPISALLAHSAPAPVTANAEPPVPSAAVSS